MYVQSFAQWPVPTIDWRDIAWVTIDKLPDVALLEIFDFYVDEARIEAWCTLVHVCRKWRSVVFGSPRRLNLRLYCEARTPVRKMLNVWPLLPIVIKARGYKYAIWGVDNIIAALKHSDRICQLELLDIPSSQMEKVLAAMQQLFPKLRRLKLQPSDEATLFHSLFLGGSSPGLQTLTLDCVKFPGLPKLLLSATHLVRLSLHRIPHSGYILPEDMATCLSLLIRLESFVIGFESPQCRPDWNKRRLPPQTRALLPALTLFQFKGASEYLEDLVAWIDAPLLDKLVMTFFNQLIFNTPQVTQFIRRTPKFKAHDGIEARIAFSDSQVCVTFPRADGALSVELGIVCSPSDWQLSALAQVCSSSFPQALIPAVEHLYIFEHRYPRLRWQDDTESSQWLELLHPFTSVKGLYVSQEFVPRIAPAMQELIGEGATAVLPAPRSLFLEEPLALPVQTIGQFIDARQLTGHPITVLRWENHWTLRVRSGYTAHTFRPEAQDAEEYFASLLKRESESGQIHCHWHTDVTGAILAASPTGIASDHHDWVIDYTVRGTGPVVQQKRWVPKKPSDKVRRVDHEPLCPPIFFIHNNGQDLGLPLVDAAGGNCTCLRGAVKAAPGPYAHAQIRINVSSISTFIMVWI